MRQFLLLPERISLFLCGVLGHVKVKHALVHVFALLVLQIGQVGSIGRFDRLGHLPDVARIDRFGDFKEHLLAILVSGG